MPMREYGANSVEESIVDEMSRSEAWLTGMERKDGGFVVEFEE